MIKATIVVANTATMIELREVMVVAGNFGALAAVATPIVAVAFATVESALAVLRVLALGTAITVEESGIEEEVVAVDGMLVGILGEDIGEGASSSTWLQ